MDKHIIADMLTAALEGGSNYWIDSFTVRGYIPDGGDMYKEFAEDSIYLVLTVEGGKYILTKTMLEKGIIMQADEIDSTIIKLYDTHDADDANYALQFAIFGKFVYS